MLAYLFVVAAVAVHLRFVALPFSFTPVVAALLFFGARMPRRQWWIPLAMMMVADLYLNRVTYGYAFTIEQTFTWAMLAAVLLLGSNLIKGHSPLRIAGASLLGSVLFFLGSNFGSWVAWRDTYPKTFNGLMTCYVAGLPFFRNAVISDLFFSAAFFGIAYIVSQKTGERAVVPVRHR